MTTQAEPAMKPEMGVPDTMTAVPLREFGPPEVLRPASMPTPTPGPGEALLRVDAVSVGRLLDVAARAGKHPYASFTFPHLLGAEHAGTVVALGAEVAGAGHTDGGAVRVGQRVAVFPFVLAPDDEWNRAGLPELSPNAEVIGTHRPGADAEYSVVPARNLLLLPDDMASDDAVAVVLAGAVAMNQFTKAGGVGPGSRVLVQGASSALGSTTALLALHLGADVLVTSRSAAKRERLRELGFTHVLDCSSPTFAADAREAFGGAGATLIVDNLGAHAGWEASLATLEPGGAVVTSGAFLGAQAPVNLQRLYSMSQRIIGVRTGTLASARQAFEEAGRGFRSVIDRTFALDDVAQAHRYVEAGGNVGRVLLHVGH